MTKDNGYDYDDEYDDDIGHGDSDDDDDDDDCVIDDCCLTIHDSDDAWLCLVILHDA